jgi:sulfite reductase (NADPH) hemoprotein beta-component
MSSDTPASKPLAANENIKSASNFLRGSLVADLQNTSTGAISEDNGQLTKFHGLYLQDDRDLRNSLKKEGKEKAFSFMLRVRLPGGVATPAQWLVLDTLAGELASPSLRLTTRQTFQFHGILKGTVPDSKLESGIRDVMGLLETLINIIDKT